MDPLELIVFPCPDNLKLWVTAFSCPLGSAGVKAPGKSPVVESRIDVRNTRVKRYPEHMTSPYSDLKLNSCG
ncbi:hypothetical protein WG66_011057 [Moniliophthora roreri]|nr:hypothetical protein WG66_011057 [Moniliophthora roreri]